MWNNWKRLSAVFIIVLLGIFFFWLWDRNQPNQAIPVPNVAEAAIFDDAGYGIYQWAAGLQLVVLYEGAYTTNDCTLGPSENAPSAAYGCRIPFGNGTTTTWSIQTTDGQTGILSVDGNTYQLPREATVIRVKADDGEKRITVYQQTLPVFQNDTADRQLQQWLAQNPDLVVFAARFGVEN